jgi:hypothetical protein
MAIIRESANLTAGLAETLYTVPAGKQAVVSINIANAADTYIAIQTSDLANAPVSSLDTTFSNGTFAYFTNDIGYEVFGSTGLFYWYRREASNKWARSDNFYSDSPHRFALPLSTSFNYDAAIAEFRNNDMYWKVNGAFDNTGRTYSSNFLSNYGAGAASLGAEGLSFSYGDYFYSMYNGLNGTPAYTNVTSGHFKGLWDSGWRVQTTCGTNLRRGNSTHYIYVPLYQSGQSPAVCMWDNGDIDHATSETESGAIRFAGITAGLYIQWIQECGPYTMICTTSGQSSGNDKLWIVNNSAWESRGVNGLTDTITCTEITNATWSSLQTDPWKVKPFAISNTGKFSFRNDSTPYPLVYDAVAGTWDTTGTPSTVSYPAELAGLEATLGDAYSFYQFGSTLNDYYIVAGSGLYTLIANYNSLTANSPLLNSLQNDSEKGGLTLKAGDKVIAYDKSSGAVVAQVYGYEEDA